MLAQEENKKHWFTRFQPYVLTSLLCFFGASAQLILRDTGAAYLMLMPTVFMTALLFGPGPGLVATAILTAFSWFCLLPPYDSFRLQNQGEVFRLGTFALMGALVSWMSSLLQDAQRRRHEAVMQAIEAREAKSRFLANMSHEIRTPLSAVLGFSEILQTPGLSAEEKAESVDAIRRNSRELASLLDDVLDLAKSEAGRLRLDRAPLSMFELIDEVVKVAADKAEDKEVRLSVETKPGVPEYVFGDKARIKQVLTSLLSNAVKFTEIGEIKFVAELSRKVDGLAWISFRVRDSGEGVPSEYVEQLFRPFSQHESSMSRRHGGVGLGLALSRQIARSMGGDLRLDENVPGEGATFTAVLPLEISSADAIYSLRGRGIDFSGRRILVVDDNRDNRLLLQRILTKTGATLTFANSGPEAIERARVQKFDLMLMDIQMPVMNGYETTRHLRSSGVSAPIIALTAIATADREQSLEAGCSDFLAKPIDKPALLATIDRHLAH